MILQTDHEITEQINKICNKVAQEKHFIFRPFDQISQSDLRQHASLAVHQALPAPKETRNFKFWVGLVAGRRLLDYKDTCASQARCQAVYQANSSASPTFQSPYTPEIQSTCTLLAKCREVAQRVAPDHGRRGNRVQCITRSQYAAILCLWRHKKMTLSGCVRAANLSRTLRQALEIDRYVNRYAFRCYMRLVADKMGEKGHKGTVIQRCAKYADTILVVAKQGDGLE